METETRMQQRVKEVQFGLPSLTQVMSICHASLDRTYVLAAVSTQLFPNIIFCSIMSSCCKFYIIMMNTNVYNS
jgi:hypothetical protein